MVDVEQEIAELITELERRKEDPKLIRYVKSTDYSFVVRNSTSRICDYCGKEYKMTHVCETDGGFIWSELQKRFFGQESTSNIPSSTPATKEPPSSGVDQIIGFSEIANKPTSYASATTTQDTDDKAKFAVIGCVVFILLILIGIIFL